MTVYTPVMRGLAQSREGNGRQDVQAERSIKNSAFASNRLRVHAVFLAVFDSFRAIRNFAFRVGIIPPMRRSLSFILVMLLVLRGLLGDAMAMGMAADDVPTATAHHHTAVTDERVMASQHQDHVGDNGQVSPIAFTADETASTPDCGDACGPSCDACGICHSALFTPNLLAQPLSPQPCALHPLSSTHFVSALAALAIKPPIS